MSCLLKIDKKIHSYADLEQMFYETINRMKIKVVWVIKWANIYKFECLKQILIKEFTLYTTNIYF